MKEYSLLSLSDAISTVLCNKNAMYVLFLAIWLAISAQIQAEYPEIPDDARAMYLTVFVHSSRDPCCQACPVLLQQFRLGQLAKLKGQFHFNTYDRNSWHYVRFQTEVGEFPSLILQSAGGEILLRQSGPIRSESALWNQVSQAVTNCLRPPKPPLPGPRPHPDPDDDRPRPAPEPARPAPVPNVPDIHPIPMELSEADRKRIVDELVDRVSDEVTRWLERHAAQLTGVRGEKGEAGPAGPAGAAPSELEIERIVRRILLDNVESLRGKAGQIGPAGKDGTVDVVVTYDKGNFRREFKNLRGGRVIVPVDKIVSDPKQRGR